MTQNTSKPTSSQNTREDKGQAKIKEQKKSFVLHVSFSFVTTASVVFMGCVFLAFVLGVMVGRGEDPEAHIAPLVTLLPSGQESEAKGVEDASKSDVEQEGESAAQESTDTPEQTDNAQVMAPEDLNYSRDLKNKPGQEYRKPKVDTSPLDAAPAPVVKAPVVEKNEAASQNAAAQASKAPVQQAATNTTIAQAPSIEAKLYDYIFQVATFGTEEPIDKLREKLEGENFRTRMDKSGKFFRVLVLMRGTEAQALELRKRMVELKLGEPMQMSKKSVE